MKTRTSGQGRPKGTPNKVTKEAREAFALLLDDNMERLQGWLDRVAEEDPAKALSLVLQLAEYTTPKMARTELTGKDGGPVVAEYPKLQVILNK